MFSSIPVTETREKNNLICVHNNRLIFWQNGVDLFFWHLNIVRVVYSDLSKAVFPSAFKPPGYNFFSSTINLYILHSTADFHTPNRGDPQSLIQNVLAETKKLLPTTCCNNTLPAGRVKTIFSSDENHS